MAKVKAANSSTAPRKIRPALTPEAAENQLISLAYDQALRQLSEGTASSQIIAHFLKRGSERERLEMERLKEENRLLKARTKAIESSENNEKLYKDAINAFRCYSGQGVIDDEPDD